MPFNPFNGSDGPNLEQGNPIGNTIKKAANATTNAAAAQVKATGKSFVDQLYGNVPTQNESPEVDENTPQSSTQQSGNNSLTSNSSTKSPAEMAQLDETRKKLQELQGQHKKEYYETTFGEEAQKKRQQREDQERQAKLQEEQEEEERKAAEKAQIDEEMNDLAPAGKGKGRNRMSQPIAVTQARTKTEVNRGSSG